MRLIKKAITLLLIWSLAILPMLEAMTQEQLSQEPESGKIIILSDKVGEIIDLEERDYYKLFLFSHVFFSRNFQSAVILQLPDGSYVVQITEEKDGVKKLKTWSIGQPTLDRFRQYIDNKAGIPNDKIIKAREQAKILANEKWTKERWREEILSDQGGTYRGAGGLLGFTLGAAAGMLIGKGFQGKKVAWQVVHEHGEPGEWGYSRWTENFYSYEYKHAPHWGAAIGGIVGATAGYFLGKKADKKYYILVPKHIRMEKTKSSWFGNYLFGFGVVGTIMGEIAGRTLYTPMSAREGEEKNVGGDEFLGGYLVGAIVGTTIMAAFKGRAKHKKLWEESLLEEMPESSLDIEVIPLDPTAFSIYPRKSPNGETYYVYRIDLLRVHF